MKHTIKNIILSVISICCLVIAIHLFLGGVDNISAADRAFKVYNQYNYIYKNKA
jgi:hypothetical protein